MNGKADVLQPWSNLIDLDYDDTPMRMGYSSLFNYCNNSKYKTFISEPGFALACNRYAYEKMGGLYDLGIVGASDSHMMKTFTNYDNNYIKKTISDGYKRSLVEYEDRVGTLTVSYIPGGIKHYFHGYRKIESILRDGLF